MAETGDDQLMPLGFCSDTFCDLFTDSLYWGERQSSPYRRGELEHSLAVILLRQSTATRLRRAQALLPRGVALVVVDGFRPTALQRDLRDRVEAQLSAAHLNIPAVGLATLADRYVSAPSDDPAAPSPHLTGGAVDLGLMRLPELLCRPLRTRECLAWPLPQRRRHAERCVEVAASFDMGCAIDTMDQLAGDGGIARLTGEQLSARALLHAAMSASGMVANSHEWWHWDAPETQRGAPDVATMAAARPRRVDADLEGQRRRMRLARWSGLTVAARLGLG